MQESVILNWSSQICSKESEWIATKLRRRVSQVVYIQVLVPYFSSIFSIVKGSLLDLSGFMTDDI